MNLDTLYTLYMINNEEIDIKTDINTCLIQYYLLEVKYYILVILCLIIIIIKSCKSIYDKNK